MLAYLVHKFLFLAPFLWRRIGLLFCISFCVVLLLDWGLMKMMILVSLIEL